MEKLVSISTKGYLIALIGIFATSFVFSQTSGTLTFTCNTTAPSSSYGLKHVLAVWLENTAQPSVFIKTRAKYGNEDDHLTSWLAKSGKSLVDAFTGATITSYTQPVSVTWNGTDVTGTVVPDGTYNLFIEMGWGTNKTIDHAVTSFTFVKGSASQNLTPAGTANISGVVIDWKPLSTLAGATENFQNICFFPNPSSGIVRLNLFSPLHEVSLKVLNEEGKVVMTEYKLLFSEGLKFIDLSACRNGLYLFNIHSNELDYTYKVLLNR